MRKGGKKRIVSGEGWPEDRGEQWGKKGKKIRREERREETTYLGRKGGTVERKESLEGRPMRKTTEIILDGKKRKQKKRR